MDTPSGRELRNKYYLYLYKAMEIFFNMGLFFGSARTEKGKSKIYFLASTPEEMAAFDDQTIKQLKNLMLKRKNNRMLMQKALFELSINDKDGRKLLMHQISKRPAVG